MSPASLRSAGILLILLPTVVFGGVSILTLLIRDPRYRQNPLRQQLWRAGHAHAGIMLIISLIALIYVDQTTLTETWRNIVRMAIPAAAIFLPAAFFLSVLSPTAAKPNILINLAYVGAISLTFGLIVLGVGLL
jgi:uncharacterized membrane protein YeiB